MLPVVLSRVTSHGREVVTSGHCGAASKGSAGDSAARLQGLNRWCVCCQPSSYQVSRYQLGRWELLITLDQPGRSVRLVRINNDTVNNDAQFGQ